MVLRLKILFITITMLLATAYVLPSIPSIQQSSLVKYLPKDKINLGLDLVGGIYLTLEVDVDKAMENSLVQTGQDLRAMAGDENIYLLRPKLVTGRKLEFIMPQADNQEALNNLIAKSFSNLVVLSAQKDNEQIRYTVAYTQEYQKYLNDMTVDQAVKTIRSRIDEFGVSEPEIRKQQGNRIQIQLPGLKDPERAIQLIGKTAHLELRLVIDDRNHNEVLPPGTELLPLLERTSNDAETKIIVERDASMTGGHISDARVSYDEQNQPIVSVSFNSRGARLFERLTEQNVKKRMAIVLDGKVYSAPVIQEKIAGGRCSISGRFTVEEAHDLALVLRAGSLPAPVTILEERSVGPSLGQESIDQGITACLAGGLLVVLFMLIYYGFSGLIANLVLILNILLILAGMALFGATLTLPGIAGIVLTIGMAVDANVLINERIREELRRGLTIKAAIREGYSLATTTIVDANVTTIIAALVLYQFGTGPIRGFAVTLTFGILASMFTAVFVSHVLFDLWTSIKKRSELSV